MCTIELEALWHLGRGSSAGNDVLRLGSGFKSKAEYGAHTNIQATFYGIAYGVGVFPSLLPIGMVDGFWTSFFLGQFMNGWVDG